MEARDEGECGEGHLKMLSLSTQQLLEESGLQEVVGAVDADLIEEELARQTLSVLHNVWLLEGLPKEDSRILLILRVRTSRSSGRYLTGQGGTLVGLGDHCPSKLRDSQALCQA